jgi:hypothetical protein
VFQVDVIDELAEGSAENSDLFSLFRLLNFSLLSLTHSNTHFGSSA